MWMLKTQCQESHAGRALQLQNVPHWKDHHDGIQYHARKGVTTFSLNDDPIDDPDFQHIYCKYLHRTSYPKV